MHSLSPSLFILLISRLTKPDKKKLFYIPQRPYMPIGSLRDQVIYPDSPGEMMSKGLSDSDLADLLDKVQLRYLLDREEGTGWATERDWMDTLSGGIAPVAVTLFLLSSKALSKPSTLCTSTLSLSPIFYSLDAPTLSTPMS